MKSPKATRSHARINRRWQPFFTPGLAPMAVAVLGLVAVAMGGFESRADLAWTAPPLALAVLGTGLALGVRRWQVRPAADRLEEAAGPLLWTVAIWMLYRLPAADVPQLILLPAGFLAWLAVSYPPGVIWLSLVAALGMETALTFSGLQTGWQLGFNLAAFGSATAALFLFARSRVYRRRLRAAFQKERTQAQSTECARDFGLTPASSGGLDSPADNRRSTVEIISASFELQLDLLRRALGLTTVAVLWPDADGREWRLRGFASSRTDLLTGPYQLGQGIIGALARTGGELAVAPVPADYSGLPYYPANVEVGSLYALRIKDEKSDSGILCVDRAEKAPWDEESGRVLRLAARKIGLEVAMGRRLEEMDGERQGFQQVYLGLCELNGALGLESAFAASMKAITALVHADFAAISLLEGEQHRVAHAEGEQAGNLIGLEFPRGEGLVGQVLKLNHPLPAGDAYPGPAPVFCRKQRLSGHGSLLILPLRKGKGVPIGALVVATREKGAFAGSVRQILELIATQVAVKIDLARAHEKINSMAATDGLTGLANHRTFQNGFDRMLYRAERQHSPLCLILCDLDHFKKINDTHGHPFGDQVLKEVAGVLGSATRKADLAARYGGEEFALLLENTDRRQGLQIAERIRLQVRTLALRHGGERISITFSGGMAVYPEDGEKKELLISRADQTLYQAKESGRDKILCWVEPRE